MRIGIILDWANPNILEMIHQLSQRGVELDLIYPEKRFDRLEHSNGRE